MYHHGKRRRKTDMPDKAQNDNRSNQLNPQHPTHWRSSGESPTGAQTKAEANRK